METIIVNKTKYYLAKDVVKTYQEHFNGCKKRVRDILIKKKVNKKDYLFVNGKKNKPIENQEKPANKDKLLLCKKWVDNILSNKPKYEILPNKIELSNEQKFTDNKGNIYDINVCGELKLNTCWFKASDIGKVFGIKNITGTLEKLSSSFITNKDYKTFIVNKIDNVSLVGNNRVLYLSYTGVLRLIFVSRSKMADLFVKWASETLFTIQFGTKEDKQKLVDKILGTDAKIASKVMSKSVNPISCVYLFSLGYVKDLRDNKLNLDLSNYDDNMIICKFGRTNDLSRRTKEHVNTYKGVKLKLQLFSFIEDQYSDDAENELKLFFTISKKLLKCDKFNELIVINKNDLKNIERRYNILESSYAKNLTIINTEMKKQQE